MPTPAIVRLNAVWLMLMACASGFTRKEGKHRWRVFYRGKTAVLPLGKHGSRINPEIQSGHVRQMVRHFQLDSTCVAGKIDIGISPPPEEINSTQKQEPPA